MSELERIIELLEQIVKNQQSALDRSAHEQSVPEFNLKDWGPPEEKLTISLCSLCRYRQKGIVAFTRIGGRSYYYLPDLLKLDRHEGLKSNHNCHSVVPILAKLWRILANAILLHKFVVYPHRINC